MFSEKLETISSQYVEKLTFIWKVRNTLKNNIQFKKVSQVKEQITTNGIGKK